jgi:hypothetical protein
MVIQCSLKYNTSSYFAGIYRVDVNLLSIRKVLLDRYAVTRCMGPPSDADIKDTRAQN